MPTAAKAVGALSLAVLAWVLSAQVPALFPDSTRFGPWFAPVNAAIGAVCGWRLLGRGAGAGWFLGVSSGLSASVAMLVLAVLGHAAVQMVRLALRRRYDDPVEAFADTVRIAAEYGAALAAPGFLGTLAAGAVAAGLLAEWSARSWR